MERSEGTVLVKDIRPGGGSHPFNLTNINGTLFFSVQDQTGGALWKSDGTAEGTVQLKNFDSPRCLDCYISLWNLIDVNGRLFFIAYDDAHGYELWTSDGTADGTVLVKDIRPGRIGEYPESSWPGSFTHVNGMLFFTADDGVNGPELWKSDGTAEGTILVKDNVPP